MPPAQVINLNPTPRTETTPLEKTLSSFSNRARQNQVDRQDTDALREIYQQYQDEGSSLQDALMSVQTRPGLSPTARVNAVKQLTEFQKYNGELQKKAQSDAEKAEKKASDIAKVRDIERRQGLESGALAAYENDPNMAYQISKPEKQGSSKATTKDKFEQSLAGEAAKEVPKLEQTIAKGSDTIANIDRIEKLAKNELSGAKGFLKSWLNTESAAELNTLGATNLDTVIKLFNPAGTLPTAKLNWIRDTFSVKAGDYTSTIIGKLNTQRIIANQSLERSKDRLRLLKEYHGNIPENVSQQFDQETGDLLDIMKEEYAPKKKENNAQKSERPGFVRVKDPQGRSRWIPEEDINQIPR